MAFKIFVLAIVNELYFRRFRPAAQAEGAAGWPRSGAARLRAALARHRSDVRLRAAAALVSFDRQRRVVDTFRHQTAAVLQGDVERANIAMELGLVPIGTMALWSFQGLGVRLRDSQRRRSRPGAGIPR